MGEKLEGGNAVPMYRPGHYVYLRDAASGDYWSVSWQPVAKPLSEASYKCRHGLSYTVYECDYSNIKASQTLCVPIGDNLELWDVRIRNEGMSIAINYNISRHKKPDLLLYRHRLLLQRSSLPA